jgi:hypothetical protein
MAELPTTREFQVQVANAPNAPMPQVSFGERQAAGLEYRAQAQFQGTMGDVLDRMTRTVFGMANEMSQRAGLQFSAENPLTPEQLTAMAKGDMSTVQLGSPLNVFNSAVRKARAIELSGHAEIEGRDRLMKLVDAAGRGEISTQEVRDQITALTNGYSQSIAKVDPEASYKFRASMGAVGGRVIEKTAELDAQRRFLTNKAKFDTEMRNVVKTIEIAATTKMPIDPETGKEISFNAFRQAVQQGFTNNAVAILGPVGAAQYVNQINKEMDNAIVNSIAQYLNVDPSFANAGNGIERLLRGDAGSASNAFQTLAADDQNKVRAAYRTAKVQRKEDAAQAREEGERLNVLQSYKMIGEFFLPSTTPARKKEIGLELFEKRAISVSQLPTFLDPEIKPGDPITFAKIENNVELGIYRDRTEIENDAQIAGMNGQQVARLVSKWAAGPKQTEEEKNARSSLRRQAGVPDVLSSFASDTERQKVLKLNELFAVFDDLKKKAMTANPNIMPDFMKLAEDAQVLYEKTTATKKAEEATIAAITNAIQFDIKNTKDKAVINKLSNIEVTVDMNTEDLLRSGLITAELKRRIDQELRKLRNRK